MRIAVWHNLPSGGGKRALYDHLRGLVARGHRVEAWCPSSADRRYLPLADFLPEHVVPFKWVASRPWIGSVSFYWDIVSRIHAMDEACQQCAEQINAGDFDVLFATACRFFRVPSIARDVQLPTVLYLHEPYRWLYEALPRLPWAALPTPSGYLRSPSYWKRFVGDLVRVQALRVQVREELTNAQAFDTVLVNSLFSRESVRRAYGLEAKVCYLGVDINKFVSHGKPRGDFVVGVSSYFPPKNIHFVIEAIARLREPRPPLLWVGNLWDDSYVEELHGLAASLGVVFEPRFLIEEGELIDILNRARLMVYAPQLEPFGYAPLEANACELPVVGVAEGGVRESIVDGVNGLLAEPTPEAVAKAIERIWCDESYGRHLGSSARQFVLQRWNLEAAIDRIEARLVDTVNSPLGICDY
jgi:glycosyltransferase involved in cell wall biosynthesis